MCHNRKSTNPIDLPRHTPRGFANITRMERKPEVHPLLVAIGIIGAVLGVLLLEGSVGFLLQGLFSMSDDAAIYWVSAIAKVSLPLIIFFGVIGLLRLLRGRKTG
jgi:hypothetical protein